MSTPRNTPAENPPGGSGEAAGPAAQPAPEASPGAVEPLSESEWSRLDRGVRRLHSELAQVLAGVPPAARHASALARHLAIDRTTCQRAVHATNRPYPGPELLNRLPGVRALRMLAEAAGRADPPVDAETLDGLLVAVDQLQGLVAELAGSQRRLKQRLEAPRQAPPAARADEGAELRRRLHDAAAALTGRVSDCWVAVFAYAPSPSDPGRLEVVRANGLVGHRSRKDAVPLVVHNFSGSGALDEPLDGPGYASLARAPLHGSSPTVVLEDFSSRPPPLVTARQPDAFLVQAIDAPAHSGDQPVDLMLATRTTMPHPAGQDPAVEEVWAMVNFPSRHLLLDVWLHRDLARQCVPSLDAHLWSPDFAQHVNDRWQTRLPDGPVLQVLGEDAPRQAPAAYPRLPELTGQLFERSGLEHGDFVGFRCEVAWPTWRTGYCLRLDFA